MPKFTEKYQNSVNEVHLFKIKCIEFLPKYNETYRNMLKTTEICQKALIKSIYLSRKIPKYAEIPYRTKFSRT